MMWLWSIGSAMGQDVAPVVQATESAMDVGTIGGGAGGIGAIIGIVLMLERVGLIRIPSRSGSQPQDTGHQTPCSALQSLSVREQERHDGITREILQLRTGIDRIGQRIDAIADRIPRTSSATD